MSEPRDPHVGRDIPMQYFGSGTAGVLFRDFWFRLAAVFLLIGVLAIGLLLPKIWLTTPDGFLPEVRISWLDVLQARSLRRSAEKLAAAGRMSEAAAAWRSAIANHPGNPDLCRGALRLLADQERPLEDELPRGYGTALWLLRLTGTNRTDLGLVLRFLDRYQLDDQVRELAADRSEDLEAPADEILLRALYTGGRHAEFDRYWQSREERFSTRTDLRVYRAAWAAAFGPAGGAADGRRLLAAARENPETRVLANRLQLDVSASLLDAPGYSEALGILVDARADRPRDHATYWQVLRVTGRREDAAALARSYARPPATPGEAILMAMNFAALGMGDFAADFLQQHQSTLGFAPDYWMTHARLLIDQRRWLDLRALALALRNSPGLSGIMEGYSHFIEGVAEARMNRPEAAVDAMSAVPTALFGSPYIARVTAAQMREEGYPGPALALLQRQEEAFREDASFWFEVTAAAFEAREDEALITAARRTYELDPEQIAHVNNYAAALLVTRTRPELAVQLTLKVLANEPDNVDNQLNHILALLQNRRLDEAEERLRQFNSIDLSRLENAVYQAAWFELHWRRGRTDLARATYDRIERRQLVPTLARWIESTYQALPAGG